MQKHLKKGVCKKVRWSQILNLRGQCFNMSVCQGVKESRSQKVKESRSQGVKESRSHGMTNVDN